MTDKINSIPTDDELFNKVMSLEVRYSSYVRDDVYVGKNSRVQRLFDECHLLWKEIHRRARLRNLFVVQSVNPYG